MLRASRLCARLRRPISSRLADGGGMPDANAEMMQGYMDGGDPDAPEPSANRSRSYRHGFMCRRADAAGKKLNGAPVVRAMADDAMKADAANDMPAI